jgi:hypothetical protein
MAKEEKKQEVKKQEVKKQEVKTVVTPRKNDGKEHPHFGDVLNHRGDALKDLPGKK